jgi:menaquinone-dependent protoporphyrinogen oxidase
MEHPEQVENEPTRKEKSSMDDKILVTFATRYGSTQQVAEAIAKTLRERGLAVDLEPMRQVRTLEGYRAVVLGAPLYIGAWHKEALNFLSRYQEALASRPVAVFALGPLHDDEGERQGAREQLTKELGKFPWFAPVAQEMFGGKYDPNKLNFGDKLIASLPASPLHNVPASDVRDWTAIRAWADSLVAKLLTAPA